MFDFNGRVNEIYTLLYNDNDGVAILSRFGPAYTTGVSLASDLVKPYKQSGTWLKSIAVTVAHDIDHDSVLIVSSDERAFSGPDALKDPLQFGSAMLVSSTFGQDLLRVKVENKAKGTAVRFLSEHVDGSVTVVPPKAQWGIGPDEAAAFTHLNLGIDRLSTRDTSELDGVLGVTAHGIVPSEDGKRPVASSLLLRSLWG
eukprot:scaffold1135_cov343-Prasinococcus_capsulatus_cf.AAC.10